MDKPISSAGLTTSEDPGGSFSSALSAPVEPSRFVLETDQASEFWQFLNGLRGDDLLIELIVNDLDAKSARTEVRFEPERLVCVGEGDPVDTDGWARLRKMKGAGHVVRAKQGLFGVKNHGLKAGFTLGNDIIVRSAGLQILQTLFANGAAESAYPGVRIPPEPDPGAPRHGTQIEVPYRRKAFVVQQGEALPFAAVDDAAIERRYEEAVATLPSRLIGIIRPRVLESYELVLSHHRLGRRVFRFRCTRARRRNRLAIFFRECREVGADGRETLRVREQAVLSVQPAADVQDKPRFFRTDAYRSHEGALFAEDGLVMEAAWPVDKSDRPRPAPGRLRYPVAYPENGEGVRSGVYAHYSAPFVSDTERHELGAQATAWNQSLIGACDDALTDAFAVFLIERHGASALELAATTDPARLKRIAERLLKARAFPTVDRDRNPCVLDRKAQLVVPSYTFDQARWSPELAAASPPGSALVDPKTPAVFLELLAAGSAAGWGKSHYRFNEYDVLERLQTARAEHFPWRSEAERRRTLAKPEEAIACLDALKVALERTERGELLGENACLPATNGALHPLSTLRKGVSLPSGLLGSELPPVIHPSVKGHAIFRFSGWKLPPYEFRDMIRDGDLKGRSSAARRRFFAWLSANPEEVERDDWPRLKALKVWPATDGSLCLFEELCAADPQTTKRLGDALRRPSREVRRLCEGMADTRVRLRVRSEPSVAEVHAWYFGCLASFPTGRALELGERVRFAAFEADVLALSRAGRMRRALQDAASRALALSGDGCLRPPSALVRDDAAVRRLRLSPEHLLVRKAVALDEVHSPAKAPTPAMAMAALRRNPSDTDALLPRLRVATTSQDPELQRDLAALACLPIEGCLWAPNQLAFRGNQGDFWGTWKTQIGATLADDGQDLYRAAGVIRSFPDPDNSRAFFTWLGLQSPSVVRDHLECVIRHVGHKHGVGAWRLQPPELEFVPVEGGPAGVELLTESEARRSAVVNDFPELAEAIRVASPPFERRLAIDSVPRVAHPIADVLKTWGVPTLSSIAKGPSSVRGSPIADAPKALRDEVRRLASPTAGRRLRKQLQELDLPQSWLEPHFQNRLFKIGQVATIGGLEAEFRIGRRRFFPKRLWAVSDGTVWLDADGDLDALLAEAMADLIFVQPRPRYLSAILKAALNTRARDWRGAPVSALEDDEALGERDEDVNDDANEATSRHPGGEPNLARNTPTPKPLFRGKGPSGRKPAPSGSTRKPVAAEDIQRRQLKAEHYAFHCQMELAAHDPATLAPAGSYAEFAENRMRMVEAHHPDKVVADGSRHAGNLLILSRLNHERVGTRLSRADVTHALKSAWTPRTILKVDGTVWLTGGVAGTADPVSGEALPLFFTADHRAYWLEMAGEGDGKAAYPELSDH